MVKILTHSQSLTNCIPCDEVFETSSEFKDHLLTTQHNGPSKGTRSFKYKLTEKTARNNIIKGAKRQHLKVEVKQGA